MIERSSVIPWRGKGQVTPKCLEDAGAVVLTELRELFPEAEGFQFNVGKQGRDIQVRRGLTWGLYVVLKGTEKGLKLKVGRDSKLTTVLAFSAFLTGIILAGMWLLKNEDPSKSGFVEFFFAWALMGFLYGVAALQLVRVIMQPWLSVPSSAVIKLMDALKEDVAEKVKLGT